MSPNIRRLSEGYFRLRKQNDALRSHGHHFEALPWSEISQGGHLTIFRSARNGWGLRVYEVEGAIEAAVTPPNGETMTYR